MKKFNAVKKIARKSNKKLTVQQAPTLFNILRSDKDLIAKQEKNRVCRIPIEDAKIAPRNSVHRCNKKDIGEKDGGA